MTSRLKTVQYSYPFYGSLTNGQTGNLTGMTIYLPEDNKSFKSVIADIYVKQDSTDNTTFQMYSGAFRLGSNSYSGYLVNWSLGSTSNPCNVFLNLQTDITNLFNTQWSGTFMNSDMLLYLNNSAGTNRDWNNIGCKYIITYEYDDQSTTHVKTVQIPFYSNYTGNATGLLPIGEIPIIDNYFPEASKTYRDCFFLIEGHTALTSTGTRNLIFSIDQTGVFTGDNIRCLSLANGAHSEHQNYIYKTWTGDFTFDKTIAHTGYINYIGPANTNAMTQTYGNMFVTYEFDKAATTGVMNSVIFAGNHENGFPTNRANPDAFYGELYVPEDNPVLKRLACNFSISCFGNNSSTSERRLRFGTGDYQGWLNDTVNSYFVLQSDVSNLVSISNGSNIFTGHFYTTRGPATSHQVGWQTYWIGNYTSDVSSYGLDAHNHTVYYSMYETNHNLISWNSNNNGSNIRWAVDKSFTKPSGEYYIQSIYSHNVKLNNLAAYGHDFYYNTGEYLTSANINTGDFWNGIRFANIGIYDGSRQFAKETLPVTELFSRYSGDPDGVDFYNSRVYRIDGSQTYAAHQMIVTYNQIYYNVNGTVYGYSGDGSNIEINLCRTSDGKILKTGLTSAGGSFSIPYYKNDEQLYLTATHSGKAGKSLDRSINE